MNTVKHEIDIIQRTLNDGGAIWARTELLRWYRDAYVQFLSRSGAMRRWTILSVPGRATTAMTQEWEDRFGLGTNRVIGLPADAATIRVTASWEAERLAGQTTTDAREMVTHLWEMLHSGEVDDHFRFHLPKSSDHILHVTYDDQSLEAVGVRALDDQDREWMRNTGEAVFWTLGLGRIRTFEVFEVENTDGQAYTYTGGQHGIPRQISGDRSYSTAPLMPSAAGWSYTTDGDRLGCARGLSRHEVTYVAATPGDQRVSTSLGTVLVVHGAFTSAVHGTQGWEDDRVTALGTVRYLGPWEQQHAESLSDDVSGPVEQVSPVGINVLRGTGAQAAIEVVDDQNSGVSARHVMFGWETAHVSSDAALLTTNEATQASPAGTASFEAKFSGRVGGSYADFTRSDDYPLGVIRSLESTSRQYLPRVSDGIGEQFVGTVRVWDSTTNNVGVVEAISPRIDFEEEDVPQLIPSQMQKHLRWYVLEKAFGQNGEGRRPDDADHYRQLFAQGVQSFKKMADVARSDRVHVRESIDAMPASRPARPRLPAEYPALARN